jgi:[lysine-biosynthesis-protein LysW]--L-2-aminoadipate ligase
VRVLLIYPANPWYRTGYDDAWIGALAERGCEVDQISAPPAEWTGGGPPPGRWQLAIPHVLVEEVVARAPSLRAAQAVEAAGVPMLNRVAAILGSSDKLATHAAWERHRLPQPTTWRLDALDSWPASRGRPLVLKPAYCDGGRHIELVRSLSDAHERERGWRSDEARGGELRGVALLQEWIEEPRCMRLYATPDETSAAYEKSRRPGALVTHGTVYARVHEPPRAMALLARRMVAALGGGLMGVDVLVDGAGRCWALEANAPFGFDITDAEQGRFLARGAIRRARRASAQARAHDAQ